MSDSEEEVAERQFKLVLLGDSGVGKTSISTRYAEERFTKQYAPTAGVDFYLKRIVLPGQRNVALKLWDVSGTALDGRMLDKYIYGANAILLVYDVSNSDSFESLQVRELAPKDVIIRPQSRRLPLGCRRPRLLPACQRRLGRRHPPSTGCR